VIYVQIQSLSVCVPTRTCPNRCPYCISGQNDQPDNKYFQLVDGGMREPSDRVVGAYLQRLAYASNAGCNTCILTGTGEPMTQPGFLRWFGEMNQSMGFGLARPFSVIEVQTSGIMLDEAKLDMLVDEVGVSTIALSLSAIDSDTNARVNGTPDKLKVDIDRLAAWIKQRNLNLRLCLNLSSVYNSMSIGEIFDRAHNLGANQLTFRELFISDIYNDTPQGRWIQEHPFVEDGLDNIFRHIEANGTKLYHLPYGAAVYSMAGMSVVVDQDCMNKEVKDDGSIKYLILRPDCHLYCRWDDPGSIIF
jgi:molybdenum cofactor biosynthesis enzyme MoaA